MAILEILVAPDPRLKKKSLPVTRFDDNVQKIIDDMVETLHSTSNGVGLAAPQVGIHQRIIIVEVGHHEDDEEVKLDPIVIINPHIVEEEDEIVWEEGCLSLPDFTAEVTRSGWVKVAGKDRHNRDITVEGDGLLAVCLQHEIDHLDGILFVDHISMLKRRMILKKLKKLKNEA